MDAVMNAVTIQISHAVKYRKPLTMFTSIFPIIKNIILGLPMGLVNAVILLTIMLHQRIYLGIESGVIYAV